MSKTVWHPASEIPPLHEESFEDGDEVITSQLSDWMLVIDDTCDSVYNGPMRVAHYVQCVDDFQWEDGSGQLKNVTHWAFPPELPEGVSHG